MSAPIAVALIGLDTSHTLAYAELMHAPDLDPARRVSGLRATACLRFETPFQGAAGLDERQRRLEEWGVPVVLDLDEATAGCDAILMLINDPAFHLPCFRRLACLGKPIFVDKPLCATPEEAREMVRIARETGVPVMSCSPVRSSPALRMALDCVGEPLAMSAYGALGTPPAGSAVVWYGVHALELVERAMGREAQRVHALPSALGCVAAIDFAGDRQAVVELSRPFGAFGGRLQSARAVAPFAVEMATLYPDALRAVEAFLRGHPNPAPVESAAAVLAMLAAIDRSLAAGGPVAVERLA